jgi:acyl-CoA reductase-like NAD-dependent aldehyde dehydrogenase
MKLDVINPANGDNLGSYNEDSTEEIREKYSRARAAQPGWAAKTLAERSGIISRFRMIVAENLEEAALTLTREVGKPISQSRNELNGMLARIDFFLQKAEQTIAREQVYVEGNSLSEEIEHEPLGVVANISAWNYPWFVGSNVYIPALLTGNTVLYKPSEYALMSGELMAKFLHKSGVPADVFSVVFGRGAAGAEILKLDIDGVFFTGSVATGLKIAQAAAAKLIKVQLELGGKDPAYISDDVDVSIAAAATADGAMYNTGQSCCSVERIYVHEKIYDGFLDAFAKTVSEFKTGTPESDETYVGALTRGTVQADFLAGQVKNALDHGGRLLLGGGIVSGSGGRYFQPTVIADANHKMELMREESFGPIIGIMKVKDDSEAQKLMNDTSYGLTAAVYCRDETRARAILSGVNAGSAYINCCDRVSPRLPWSGRRQSGVGLTLSTYGIETFTRPKAWHVRSA